MQRLSDKLVNWGTQTEQATLEQAALAASLPFVQPWVSVMADAHPGKGSTVGTVIPTNRAIIPAAVGVDIGCGMQAARLAYRAGDIDLQALRLDILDEIPMGIGPQGANKELTLTAMARVDRLSALAKEEYERYQKNWELQLGSLGSGNHFIEVAKDEDNYLWLTLHSGSRGIGKNIAEFHMKQAQKVCDMWHVTLPHRDLAYFPEGDANFWQYMRVSAGRRHTLGPTETR